MVPASSPIAVPAALDSAVDAAIAAVNAQVAAAEAAIQQATSPAEPEAPNPPESVTVNGVLVSPETHLFENGVPLLTPTGRPRLKPEARKTKKAAKDIATVAEASQQPMLQPVVAGTQAPPVIKETVKSTTATVTKVYGKIGVPETKDEEIAVRTFITNPAMVEIGYGLTLNIGNYESARIDVRISLPCYREETDDAFSFAKKWTEDRIQTEVKAIRQIASGTKSTTPF
jgi:hypothetical protein